MNCIQCLQNKVFFSLALIIQWAFWSTIVSYNNTLRHFLQTTDSEKFHVFKRCPHEMIIHISLRKKKEKNEFNSVSFSGEIKKNNLCDKRSLSFLFRQRQITIQRSVPFQLLLLKFIGINSEDPEEFEIVFNMYSVRCGFYKVPEWTFHGSLAPQIKLNATSFMRIGYITEWNRIIAATCLIAKLAWPLFN